MLAKLAMPMVLSLRLEGQHHPDLRNEFDAFHAWRVCDGTDNLVRPEVE